MKNFCRLRIRICANLSRTLDKQLNLYTNETETNATDTNLEENPGVSTVVRRNHIKKLVRKAPRIAVV